MSDDFSCLRYTPGKKAKGRTYRAYAAWRKANGLPERCDSPECVFHSNPLFWNGKPLRLDLDHKNGNNWDHSPENLRYLCPNCHRQTETFGGANRGRVEKDAEGFSVNNKDGSRDVERTPFVPATSAWGVAGTVATDGDGADSKKPGKSAAKKRKGKQ